MTAIHIESFSSPFRASFPVETSFDVRIGSVRPAHAVYLRRRLVVGLVFAALTAVLGMSAQAVLADRGGVPASTPAIQPDAASIGAAGPSAAPVPPVLPAAAATMYLVQPGDTLWGIADRMHGSIDLDEYLEQLVAANGGASVDAGQLLALP